jgi:VWFA-related protein
MRLTCRSIAVLVTFLLGAVTLTVASPASPARSGEGRSPQQAGPASQTPPTPQAAPQRPSFSAGTILVPVVVRVIDNKTMKPVADLQQEDFTVLENGLPQQIRHFERHAFAPDAAPAPGARPPIRETALGLAPQNGRIILLVFGRGRLQEPSKALDALQRFVREQLLPQDQVAVFAYDRASDFTTDHEQVARFIERFKKAHYDIDMEVRLAIESSMAAVYGSRSLPKSTRQKIDNMFTGAGLLGSREVGKGETDSTKRAEQDFGKQVDQVQRADAAKTNAALYADAVRNLGVANAGPPPSGWTALDEIQSPLFASLGLDNFMEVTARSLQDLGNCYAAIEYLRHLEGDKHLVFVTERGMNLPRLEDDMDLSKAANDARVAIDTFQVGGLEGQVGGVWTDQSQQTFAFRGLRLLAEQTGGVSSISEDGLVAVNRINEVSRSEYLLAFYPGGGPLNGDYRKIEVRTRRQNVTLLYRRGYFAKNDVGAYNRRDAVTRERMMAAATFRRDIGDIKVKMEAKQGRNAEGKNEISVRGTIDTSRLFLSLADGQKTGAIDILIVCFNDKEQAIGQFYQRAAIDLAPDAFEKASRSGLPYNVQFEASPATRRVRTVVYDYRADLIGSADARIF